VKSKLLIFAISLGLFVPLRASAVPWQDLDRINNIINQARSLADSARTGDQAVQQATAQEAEFNNPFARDDSTSGLPAQDANQGVSVNRGIGLGVGVDKDKIRVNAGGRQFNIPRVSGYASPKQGSIERDPLANGKADNGNGINGINPHALGAQTLLYYPPGYTPLRVGVFDREPSAATRAVSMAAGFQSYADAVRSFRSADFAKAAAQIQQAESTSTEKHVLYPFHSLCRFAVGDFEGAAEKAYVASARSRIWSWEQLRGYYGNPDAYAQQYSKLQNAAKQPSAAASLRFLLGYHHLMLGHRQDASEEFERVLKQLPNDPVTMNLLTIARQAPPIPAR